MDKYTRFVVLVICFWCVTGQGGGNNAKCVNDLLKWCSGMSKSNMQGNFLTSDVSSSGERRTIHCMAGSKAANCTWNNSPWFACHRDGVVTYKNNVLHENYPAFDDGVCEASKKAKDMFTYDTEEARARWEAGRRAYEAAMRNMQDTFQRTIFRPCFPFCNGFPFGK